MLLEELRWNGCPTCPYCEKNHCTAIPSEYRYHCNNCNTNFSVTVRALFHRTHIPLQKWFLAIWLLLGTKSPPTFRHLGQVVGVNKDTACRIANKICSAQYDRDQRQLLASIVERIEC